jgi:hypothetical protein
MTDLTNLEYSLFTLQLYVLSSFLPDVFLEVLDFFAFFGFPTLLRFFEELESDEYEEELEDDSLSEEPDEDLFRFLSLPFDSEREDERVRDLRLSRDLERSRELVRSRDLDLGRESESSFRVLNSAERSSSGLRPRSISVSSGGRYSLDIFGRYFTERKLKKV